VPKTIIGYQHKLFLRPSNPEELPGQGACRHKVRQQWNIPKSSIVKLDAMKNESRAGEALEASLLPPSAHAQYCNVYTSRLQRPAQAKYLVRGCGAVRRYFPLCFRGIIQGIAEINDFTPLHTSSSVSIGLFLILSATRVFMEIFFHDW